MDKLSQILWRERDLLETLLFRLHEERLVLAGGEARWAARAADEVDSVLVEIRETEVMRAVAADQVAHVLGLRPGASLQELAEAAEEPWRSIFLDHHDAIATVTEEIAAAAEDVRAGVTVAGTTPATSAQPHDGLVAQVTRIHDRLGDDASTGHGETPAPRALRPTDRHEAALADLVADRAMVSAQAQGSGIGRTPSLMDFLR